MNDYLEYYSNFYANKIVEDVKKSISSLNVPAIQYGDADIDYTVSLNGTKITITAGGWKFFMSEFGKGSLLDRNNPWLQEYIQSEIFNKARPDKNYAILSRTSGANLEEKVGWQNPSFLPYEAQHFLDEAIDTYIPMLIDDLTNAMIESIATKLVKSIPTKIYI